MTIAFHAEANPQDPALNEVAALAPANPFFSAAHVRAKRDLGCQPWIVGLRREEEWLAACPAFLRRGRWNRSLEIESLAGFDDAGIFWAGFLEFCRQQQIAQGEIGTYGSPPVGIPPLRGETERLARCEHLLALKNTDLLQLCASQHKRNIKRGQKAGLHLHSGTDSAACLAHAQLIGQSMQRRKERGETVSEDADAAEFAVYLRHGAGELFQATTAEGTVLSSLLVFTASRGGYYHSAGTSPQGMGCGASPWLVHNIARTLQERGLEVFNLGGAIESNPGLFRFKTEFGTSPVRLETATFILGSTLWRKCKAALGRICLKGNR